MIVYPMETMGAALPLGPAEEDLTRRRGRGSPMARSLWSGSVSFGLVNVPVRLFTATSDKSIHFHQVDEKTGARIRHKRVSEKSGREVDNDRIANGYERSKGKVVIVTDDELSAADPERSHTIDIEAFVPLADIDPLHYDKAYWVSPADQEGAKKAYALLRTAMEKKEQVAVGRFVLRTKEHLVALRPLDGALALQTMRFADEIVKPSTVEGLPVRTKAGTKELKSAEQLIDALSDDWDPSSFRDRHRARVKKIIDKKAKGQEITVEEPKEDRAEVLDLMQALEDSVAAARKGKRRRKTA
jgi:DNA end-binding protein Ku